MNNGRVGSAGSAPGKKRPAAATLRRAGRDRFQTCRCTARWSQRVIPPRARTPRRKAVHRRTEDGQLIVDRRDEHGDALGFADGQHLVEIRRVRGQRHQSTRGRRNTPPVTARSRRSRRGAHCPGAPARAEGVDERHSSGCGGDGTLVGIRQSSVPRACRSGAAESADRPRRHTGASSQSHAAGCSPAG